MMKEHRKIQIVHLLRYTGTASVFRPHWTGIQGFLPLPPRSRWSRCRILHQGAVGYRTVLVRQDVWSWWPSTVQTLTWECQARSSRVGHHIPEVPWRLRQCKLKNEWKNDKHDHYTPLRGGEGQNVTVHFNVSKTSLLENGKNKNDVPPPIT